MRTDRSRWFAFLAALLALTLVACGGDDDDGDAASDPETEDTATDDTGDEGGGDADITIAGSAFSVAGPVPAGEAVVITNEDSFTHTVTADDDGGFDVEVPGGEDASIDEDLEPGTYPFHCDIHPSMTGELVIE